MTLGWSVLCLTSTLMTWAEYKVCTVYRKGTIDHVHPDVDWRSQSHFKCLHHTVCHWLHYSTETAVGCSGSASGHTVYPYCINLKVESNIIHQHNPLHQQWHIRFSTPELLETFKCHTARLVHFRGHMSAMALLVHKFHRNWFWTLQFSPKCLSLPYLQVLQVVL